jgi:outer membrane receptor for ferrienterochelin and colicins
LIANGQCMKKSRVIWLMNIIVCLLVVMPLFAQEEDEELEDEDVDLELEELFNVKVSVASKKAEDISDAPGVIYVVSQDELQRSGALTLTEVLMRVPSMGIATTALTSRKLPVMRGDLIKINSGHLLFLLNGRPVREVQEGGVNCDFIESFPVDAIEQIEVIRGPGSVLYGSDAFSGVINITTKRPVDEPVTFSVTGNYEVFTGGGGSGNIMYKNGDFEVTAAGRYYEKPDWNPEVMRRIAVQTGTIPGTSIPIYSHVDSIIDTVKIVDYGPGAFLDVKFKGLSAMFSFVQWTTGAFQKPTEIARQQKLFGNVGYETEILDNWQTEINVTG